MISTMSEVDTWNVTLAGAVMVHLLISSAVTFLTFMTATGKPTGLVMLSNGYGQCHTE